MQTINALDDGETWGGPGTVFRVPSKYGEELINSDDLQLEVPADDGINTRHVWLGDLPGVKAYDVDRLMTLYRYLVKHPPRDPKINKLVQRVELT